MTNEEAVKKLQNAKLKFLDEYVDYTGLAEAYQIGINAIEKQIPERVETGDRCPSCHMDVVGSGFHCWKCGQRLDWGNGNGKNKSI